MRWLSFPKILRPHPCRSDQKKVKENLSGFKKFKKILLTRKTLKYSGIFILAISLLTLSGYIYGERAYKIPTLHYLQSPGEENLSLEKRRLKEEALRHPLYRLIPRKREQIRSWDIPHWIAWNLFGNDDDGIFGEETEIYGDEPISFFRFLKWTLRNPLHNFTFYTIGSAGRKEHHTFILLRIDAQGLRYLEKAKRGMVFGKGRNAFYLALHDHKPFFSLKLSYLSRQLRFYIGWRERGNFGIKFQPALRR